MARPRLSSPDQPPLLRWTLRLYELCASLQLAVVLLLGIAFALAAATFIESAQGTAAVQFGVYGTWWFELLNALLALNIFCAAAIRYPWSRKQTGFVITHIGLLTLLFGCLMSRRGGVDAQMPVFEGQLESKAFEDSHHLEIFEDRDDVSPPELLAATPFPTGPFNWEDYGTKLSFIPWSLADRVAAGDVLYDDQGVRLEVLDFYSDCRRVPAPYVELEVSLPPMAAAMMRGEAPADPSSVDSATETEPTWQPVTLAVQSSPGAVWGEGMTQRIGGGRICFWMLGDDAALAAFLDGGPVDEATGAGQVVLHLGGEKLAVSIDELDSAENQQRELPRGGRIELVQRSAAGALDPDALAEGRVALISAEGFSGASPAVELNLFQDDESPVRLVLFADDPTKSAIVAESPDAAPVFAEYWLDRGELSAGERMTGAAGKRIDVVQGPDEKLYYRNWDGKTIVAAGALPADSSAVDAFAMTGGSTQLRVGRFVASPTPDFAVLGEPFDSQRVFWMKQAAAKMRLTVDGNTGEFWLFGMFNEEQPRESQWQIHRVEGKGRTIAVSMPADFVDVGFRVRMQKFRRRLDPGTSQASHYSSIVDFVDGESARDLRSDVEISMNAPVDFTSPEAKKSYRMFQESFDGPHRPGDPRYRSNITRIAAADYQDSYDEELYQSTLTVNFDPGRGVKYVGSLLITAGIATMFYMRAYFFQPRGEAAKRRPSRRKDSAPK